MQTSNEPPSGGFVRHVCPRNGGFVRRVCPRNRGFVRHVLPTRRWVRSSRFPPRRRCPGSSTSGTPVERVHPDLAVGAVAPSCCDTSPPRTKIAKIAGPRRVQSSRSSCNLRRRRDQPLAILTTARTEAFRDESRRNSSGPNRSSRGQKRHEALEYLVDGPKSWRSPNLSICSYCLNCLYPQDSRRSGQIEQRA